MFSRITVERMPYISQFHVLFSPGLTVMCFVSNSLPSVIAEHDRREERKQPTKLHSISVAMGGLPARALYFLIPHYLNCIWIKAAIS